MGEGRELVVADFRKNDPERRLGGAAAFFFVSARAKRRGREKIGWLGKVKGYQQRRNRWLGRKKAARKRGIARYCAFLRSSLYIFTYVIHHLQCLPVHEFAFCTVLTPSVRLDGTIFVCIR
jgi:hypothetical protein